MKPSLPAPAPAPALAPAPEAGDDFEGRELLAAVVGRMLTDSSSIASTAAVLLPEELPAPLDVVYVSVLAVHAAGEPVDPVTVGVHLHRRGLLKKIGGSTLLRSLVRAALPAPAQVPQELTEAWTAVIARFIDRRGTLDTEHRRAMLCSWALSYTDGVLEVAAADEKDRRLLDGLPKDGMLSTLRKSLPEARDVRITAAGTL
ncbi:DnaB-like helicase N-terminal domain-containing protein [Streptomyces termitum]|uniref:DnaB-like helicase N-terminal domain-containing protein n=1 Tax=Streptomyces termitum TaxID=67368 RepID=UPI0033A0A983